MDIHLFLRGTMASSLDMQETYPQVFPHLVQEREIIRARRNLGEEGGCHLVVGLLQLIWPILEG